MCGFTGLYQKKFGDGPAALKSIAVAMSDSLRHRGPDHGAVWQDSEAPIALAHRRLSIIDLSPEGHQPMRSASGRYVIIYNGEFYNYLDLKKELEGAGIKFRGRSDTEIFLAAVEQWGLNRTLQKINGMFAIALWDRKEREVHLIRDRLGKKPLYIGWAGSTLVFGSELKALHAHPDFKAQIDPDTVALYMRYGYVPAPHCIYKNVWTLKPGHRMTLRPAQVAAGEDLQPLMDPYWHHARVAEDARHSMVEASEEEIIDEFEALLSACVQERLISDVPLGAFLSGGIDSSTVVALMQKISPGSVKTYTIGFNEADFNEAGHAATIAAHLGADHHALFLSGQDALNVIPKLPDIYDEPFADISAIPTCLISEFARKDVTVALSGDGGDEMLGGYNRHVAGPKLWNVTRFMPGFMRDLSADLLGGFSPGRLGISSIHMQKLIDAMPARNRGEMYERLLTQWDVPTARVIDPGFEPPERMSFAEEMMYRDALSYLPDNVLVKVDRASMAVSLECRAPLLDKKIYEYVWRLPERYKIRQGRGKWLLRQVLARHVPAGLFERPKQGFSVPVDAWLRGPLKDWAATLFNEMDEGLLNRDMILRTWQQHLNGTANHGQRMWVALMLLSWQKRWL
ncbi:MAG: asparagine synthase (glutamine-hydrolyzing) [Alphaproteobacteria bacterium]